MTTQQKNIGDATDPQDAVPLHQTQSLIASALLEADGIATGSVQLSTLAFPATGLILAKVAAVLDYFALARASTATADGISIVTAFGGVGRWIRLEIADPSWILRTSYTINPSAANDEGLGDSSHPLKTRTELARRLGTRRLTAGQTTVTITGDLNAGDVRMPQCASDITNFISWVGVPTVLFSGAITALTSRSGSGSQPTLMTMGSLSGSSWAPYVGKLVQWTDGSGHFLTSRINADLGLKQALLSPPINELNVEGAFTNGQTVSILDVPSLGANELPMEGYRSDYTYLKVATRWLITRGQVNLFHSAGDGLVFGGSVSVLNGWAINTGWSSSSRLLISGGYVRLICPNGSIRISITATILAMQVEGTGSICCIDSSPTFGRADFEFYNPSTSAVPMLHGGIGEGSFNTAGYTYGACSVANRFLVQMQGRGTVASFGHVPNVTGADLISYDIAGVTENVSVLATRESNDVCGNRVIGPAGPTLNDNRSQPLAHLGSGGATRTNAANIGDIQDLAGVTSVATKAALLAIDVTHLTSQIRRVDSYKDYFFLTVDADRTAIPDEVLATSDPTKWWVRMFVPDPYWGVQPAWIVDPINGDDENEGDVAGVGNAIKTRTEYARRTDGQPLRGNVTINITSDLLSTDTRLPHRPQSALTFGGASGYIIRYQGTKIALFTGTLGGVVARAGATGITTKLTLPSLPTSWTASGLVGKIVEGLDGSGNLVRSTVVADLGSKTAWVSPPMSAAYGVSSFADLTALTVYDAVNLSTGGSPTVQAIEYHYAEFDYCKATQWELFGHYFTFTNCIGPCAQYSGTNNVQNCVMDASVVSGTCTVAGGYGQHLTSAGAQIKISRPSTYKSSVIHGGCLVTSADVEVNATSPAVQTNQPEARIEIGGFLYGPITGGSTVIQMVAGSRDCLVSLKAIPNFGGAAGITFIDAGTTGSTATLSSAQVDDINNNRVIGPAGPTLNDNRGQPIAHLGSGGTTSDNAANIADARAIAAAAAVPGTAGAVATTGHTAESVLVSIGGTVVDLPLAFLTLVGRLATGDVVAVPFSSVVAGGGGGAGITALTGDGSATGPGSAAFTLGNLPQSVLLARTAVLTAAMNVNGQQILSLADPTTAQGAATKSYVDAIAAGMRWKAPVRAASTGNVNLATLAAGSVQDGVTLAAGDRFGAKDQTTGSENGLYLIGSSGPAVRTTDADTGVELVSAAFFVQSGTANGDRAFVCTNDAVTIGTTPIILIPFGSSIGALLAANNLSDLTNPATARTNLGLATIAATGSASDLVSGTVPQAATASLTGHVTKPAGSSVTTLVEIPTHIPVDGDLVVAEVAAPAAPAAGHGDVYVDSTSHALAVKTSTGVVSHTVQTKAAATSQFVTGIHDDGSVDSAQPGFGDLTGSLAGSQFPGISGVVNVSPGGFSSQFGAAPAKTILSNPAVASAVPDFHDVPTIRTMLGLDTPQHFDLMLSFGTGDGANADSVTPQSAGPGNWPFFLLPTTRNSDIPNNAYAAGNHDANLATPAAVNEWRVTGSYGTVELSIEVSALIGIGGGGSVVFILSKNGLLDASPCSVTMTAAGFLSSGVVSLGGFSFTGADRVGVRAQILGGSVGAQMKCQVTVHMTP